MALPGAVAYDPRATSGLHERRGALTSAPRNRLVTGTSLASSASVLTLHDVCEFSILDMLALRNTTRAGHVGDS